MSTLTIAKESNIERIRYVGNDVEVLVKDAKGLTFGELCQQIEAAAKIPGIIVE